MRFSITVKGTGVSKRFANAQAPLCSLLINYRMEKIQFSGSQLQARDTCIAQSGVYKGGLGAKRHIASQLV